MPKRSRLRLLDNPAAEPAAGDRRCGPPSAATTTRRESQAAGLKQARWKHQERTHGGGAHASPATALGGCRAHELAVQLAHDASEVSLPPAAVKLHYELSRAAMSVHVNLAEALGTGPTGMHQLFRARGSLWEVQSCLRRARISAFDHRIADLNREIDRLINGFVGRGAARSR